MNATKFQFPAGTYYVGDLCYILRDEWREVISLHFHESDYGNEGVSTLKDGRSFAMFGTAYGDGIYLDQKKREFLVDSGTIGCVRVKRGQKPVNGGHLIKFDKPFNTEKKRGGLICIGPVEIDTDPEDDEEENDCCPHCGHDLGF